MTSDDLISVDSLAPALRQYLRRSEREAGRVSLTLLRQRQRGAEGRVMARAREAGQPLFVAERHSGDSILTTMVSGEIDVNQARTR